MLDHRRHMAVPRRAVIMRVRVAVRRSAVVVIVVAVRMRGAHGDDSWWLAAAP